MSTTIQVGQQWRGANGTHVWTVEAWDGEFWQCCDQYGNRGGWLPESFEDPGRLTMQREEGTMGDLRFSYTAEEMADIRAEARRQGHEEGVKAFRKACAEYFGDSLEGALLPFELDRIEGRLLEASLSKTPGGPAPRWEDTPSETNDVAAPKTEGVAPTCLRCGKAFGEGETCRAMLAGYVHYDCPAAPEAPPERGGAGECNCSPYGPCQCGASR